MDLHRAERHQSGKAHALLVLGDVARDLGEPGEVHVRCEESLVIYRDLGDPLGEGFSLHNLAVAAFAERNLEQAQTLCEESLAIFQRLDVRGARGGAGQPGADPGHRWAARVRPRGLTDALELAWRVGPRWVVAASLEGIANVAARQSRRSWRLSFAARPLRLGRRSKILYAQIGKLIWSRPWRGRRRRSARDLRRRVGAGPERPLPDVIALAAQLKIASPAPDSRNRDVQETDRQFGLSPRELDVLHLLVASWQTDREIADTLFISPRTASKHVGAILAKLGVASRGDACLHRSPQPCLTGPPGSTFPTST